MLAGYCKHVRVFDATRPGRECSVLAVGDKQHENNNSIVSTVAQHPSSHGLCEQNLKFKFFNSFLKPKSIPHLKQQISKVIYTFFPTKKHLISIGLFGAGCYNSTVALYSTEIGGVLMPFYGPQHGVTQITFSQDGTSCFSRLSPLSCWFPGIIFFPDKSYLCGYFLSFSN